MIPLSHPRHIALRAARGASTQRFDDASIGRVADGGKGG